jgi:hypothetical protein
VGSGPEAQSVVLYPLNFGKLSSMRRIALICLALTLSGCGYKTWWNPPFSGGSNPNEPIDDSENMLRVRGQEPSVQRLTTEPGDIWPGPLPPPQTLKDLVNNGGLTPEPEQPVPGSPLSRGTAPPSPSPIRAGVVRRRQKTTRLAYRRRSRHRRCPAMPPRLLHLRSAGQAVRSFKLLVGLMSPPVAVRVTRPR